MITTVRPRGGFAPETTRYAAHMTLVAAATLSLPVHLSTLVLDLEHPDAAAETGDCHRMHARVAALFDAIPCPDATRVLWSVPRPDVLILQGPVPVTARHLPPGYVLSATARTVTVPAEGARVAVSVVANPTMRPSIGIGQRAQRTPLPPQRRGEWLTRKLDGAIRLDDPVAGQDLPPARGRREGAQVTVARYCYRSEGTVTDQVGLARLLLSGIGAGKGYGCGLLLIQERPR